MLEENDEKNILKFEDKTAVLIEIGNVQTEKGSNMLKTSKGIANQIFIAIRDYYEK